MRKVASPRCAASRAMASTERLPAPAAADATSVAAGAGNIESEDVAAGDADLAGAAEYGMQALEECWKRLPKHIKPTLEAALNRRHKIRAAEVDASKEQKP